MLLRPRNICAFLDHSKLFFTSQLRISKKSFTQLTTVRFTVMSKPLNKLPNITALSQFSTSTTPELSKKEQLKRAFKDYGTTIILFHIGMSLCSLGVWYLIISSGLDVPELLKKINIDESKLQLASGASTFVVAYALHKLTAPVRISITLAATPFIVSYLRRIGVLKVKNVVQPSVCSKPKDTENPLLCKKRDGHDAEKAQSSTQKS